MTEPKLLLLPLAVLAWLWAGAARAGWTRWLGVQVAVALVVEHVAWWMARHDLPNLLYYNVYLLLDFLLLTGVVVEVGGRGRRVLRLAAVCTLLFLAAYVYDLGDASPGTIFLNKALVIGGFLLAVQAGVGLFRLLDDGYEPLQRRPAFWALLSIVLYSLSATPVFGLYNYLAVRNPELADRMYAFNDVLFCLRYALVAWSFALAGHQYNRQVA